MMIYLILKERATDQKFCRKKIPVLGMFGSQLIAKLLVEKYIMDQKRNWFYNDLKISNDSSLFSDFKSFYCISLAWHTFDLPEGAKDCKINWLLQTKHFNTKCSWFTIPSRSNEKWLIWLDNTEEKLEKIPYIHPKKFASDIDGNISSVNLIWRNFTIISNQHLIFDQSLIYWVLIRSIWLWLLLRKFWWNNQTDHKVITEEAAKSILKNYGVKVPPYALLIISWRSSKTSKKIGFHL